QSVQTIPPCGSVFAAYLILTGIARFLVEFIRINPRSFFGLTNAQAASLVSIVAGAVLWAYLSSPRQRAAVPLEHSKVQRDRAEREPAKR
ncbi:MAG: prolipoprotein diacylglyceryl transferase family protein, partial [Candidatus Acidiferrales bacterium]